MGRKKKRIEGEPENVRETVNELLPPTEPDEEVKPEDAADVEQPQSLAEQLAESRAETARLKKDNKDLTRDVSTAKGENQCEYIDLNAPECDEDQWPLCRIQRCPKIQKWWAANGYDIEGNKIKEKGE